MSWDSVRGHDRALEELNRAFELGRLPHALLFVGPEGIGKRFFAKRLAAALLCERAGGASLKACGACPACVQVNADTHPDLLQIGRPADKHELPISVIRELCQALALKPMRGGRRVAIVDDADELNEEAANAFLKTLEEPPPGSVLILIGTAPDLQLDTVLSRCRVVRFDPLGVDDLAAILLDQAVVTDSDAAQNLARRAEGSVKRAIGLASPELERFRRELIETIARSEGFDAPGLALKVEAFAKDAGKESVLHRERASLLVLELSRFFRGVLRQTAGLEDASADPVERRAAAQVAQRLEPEAVFVLVERCLTADYQIQRRAYLPLVLTALMHDLHHQSAS